jgi:hypothetical protein
LDPHPADFQPLGSDEFVAIRREEALAVLASNPRLAGDAALYRDDVLMGGAFEPAGDGWLSHGLAPTSIAAGDLDGDGCPEPILAGIETEYGIRLGTLRIGQPDPIGGALGIDHVQRLLLATDPLPGELTDIQVAAADVDGDGLDELLVGEQWNHPDLTRVSVLKYLGQTSKSPSPDFETLFEIMFYSGGVWITPAQLDEDPAQEVLVTFCTAYEGCSALHVLYDDLNSGFNVLGSIWGDPGDELQQAPVVGEFDGDPLDEFVIEESTWDEEGQRAARLVAYDWDGSDLASIADFVYMDFLAWSARLGRGLVVADRNNDGRDEVLWISNREAPGGLHRQGCFAGLIEATIELRSWTPTSDEAGLIDLGAAYFDEGDVATCAIAVLDECGDGTDVVMTATKIGPTELIDMRCVHESDEVDVLPPLVGTSLSQPLLCCADYDDDGLRLRWLGTKDLELPTPVPMARVSSPPIKLGILQNYDKSTSVFNTPASPLPAMRLSFGTTVSLDLGRQVADLFGIIGVPECRTFGEACAASVGTDPLVLDVDEFNGPHNKDSLVFAGVLYQVYQYEVESAPNPAAVGGQLSINVPVASKCFKWSADYYNEVMPFEYDLPPDAFDHVIGEPASYPTEAQLTNLLSGYGGPFLGWESDCLTVVMGGATHHVDLEMADLIPPGHNSISTVEDNLELKAGGPLTGLTVGLFEPTVYSLELLREASFRGAIGDIHAFDWQDWFFDVGMVLYTRDLSGELPCQVLEYWTEPLGNLYE